MLSWIAFFILAMNSPVETVEVLGQTIRPVHVQTDIDGYFVHDHRTTYYYGDGDWRHYNKDRFFRYKDEWHVYVEPNWKMKVHDISLKISIYDQSAAAHLDFTTTAGSVELDDGSTTCFLQEKEADGAIVILVLRSRDGALLHQLSNIANAWVPLKEGCSCYCKKKSHKISRIFSLPTDVAMRAAYVEIALDGPVKSFCPSCPSD